MKLQHNFFNPKLTKLKIALSSLFFNKNKLNLTIIFTFLTLLLSIPATAQNYETDAIHIATENYAGSARFTALSGAFSSVGADLSNLSHNPGGVGMYRSSLFQVSLGYTYAKNKTTFYNEELDEFKGNMAIPSAGAVFATKKPSKSGKIRNAAFAIGVNQLANYAYYESIENFNTTANSSITNIWATEMNEVYGNTNVDLIDGLPTLEDISFETFNAYYGYLVNWIDTPVYSYTTPIQGSFLQKRYNEKTGTKHEMYVSAGANYLDKLYFGATIGIPILNYRINSVYSEKDTENDSLNTFFNEFEMQNNYKMEGLGFNFKAGAIYKPTQWLRVAAAFHTPERISITEDYSNQLDSKNDLANTNYDAITGEANYKLRLPWKANAGMSFFFKNHGFVSVDYQTVGYKSTKYDFGNDYREYNDLINSQLKNKYQNTHQVRVGVEGIIKVLRLRAGYSYTTSPIKKAFRVNTDDLSRHSISGGLGFLFKERFALDFAYIHYLSKEFEQPYLIDGVNVSGINKKINRGTGVLSFAYRFR